MTISGGSGKGKLKITKGYASFGTQCRLVKKGSNLTIKTRGRAGECRFKISKSGDRTFNEVETPSLSLQVTH